MKKYIIAGVLVVAVVAYLIFANRNSTPVATMPSGTADATGPTSTPTTTLPSDNPPGSATGQYKDGTYTGSVADAFYGNLQAVVTIQGGLITDVTFPQAPSGGHSSDVSAVALPELKQEAIAAQSANVNIVSGATQDSQAFQQSLAVALAQAKS
ncbi:MAG TPA: FMN-binding protein [Candidatus Paceibacterota bacterium]|nr:FMN-binding protein [Candidatus Paceibacterota bacterium]